MEGGSTWCAASGDALLLKGRQPLFWLFLRLFRAWEIPQSVQNKAFPSAVTPSILMEASSRVLSDGSNESAEWWFAIIVDGGARWEVYE